MPDVNLRTSEVNYLKGLLAQHHEMLSVLSGLVGATESERRGYTAEQQLIDSVTEALKT